VGREAVFVIAADETHLGTIPMGSITTNLGWGEDGSTLFITTEGGLLRLRASTRGPGFSCHRVGYGDAEGKGS
jgi:gluconolactonase